jgi:GNAT superfamily N-acetyltransferase
VSDYFGFGKRGAPVIAPGMTETQGPFAADALTILPWHPSRAGDFATINTEWIEAMFVMEDTDRAVLSDPQGQIIDGGGDILFVAAGALGVVGAGALRHAGDGHFELTKMGVRTAARGLKAGEPLLAALITRARELGAHELFLLTNRDCAAAIHLYEKAGFVHDPGVMAAHGGDYARCDVAMRFPL